MVSGSLPTGRTALQPHALGPPAQQRSRAPHRPAECATPLPATQPPRPKGPCCAPCFARCAGPTGRSGERIYWSLSPVPRRKQKTSTLNPIPYGLAGRSTGRYRICREGGRQKHLDGESCPLRKELALRTWLAQLDVPGALAASAKAFTG